MPPASPTPAETLRLFIALWPDDGARAWLSALDASIGWPTGAAREGAARWHMTLHFLGAVPRAQLAELVPALEQPFEPFDLELGHLAAWPRGLLVVEPLQPEPALRELHARLGQALRRAGQRVEARTFRPHLTLARRAARAVAPAAPADAQRWPVAAYALVASAGGRYRNLAQYPSGVLSGAAADPTPATAQSRPARAPTPR